MVLRERIHPLRRNRFVDDFESMPFTLAHVSHKLDSPIGVGLLYFNKGKYNVSAVTHCAGVSDNIGKSDCIIHPEAFLPRRERGWKGRERKREKRSIR